MNGSGEFVGVNAVSEADLGELGEDVALDLGVGVDRKEIVLTGRGRGRGWARRRKRGRSRRGEK